MPSEHRQLQLARSWCHSRSSGGPWVQSSPSKGKYWRVCSQADFQVVAGGLANQPSKVSHRPMSTRTATTGVPGIGYRITDAYADPPGMTDHLHPEVLFRLP